MKKTVTPRATPTTWDPEALYTKAERYIQQTSLFDTDGWEYALWSSLALEHLARAALANISPALLADTEKSWASLYHALGFPPNEEKFTPKSIAVSEVFKRLSAILEEFTKEHEGFGTLHTGRRNAELHSGELAFDGVRASAWQPRFYETCEVLLSSMELTLEDFFGKEEASVAKKLMDSAADRSAIAVRAEVAAHKRVWLGKAADDKANLSAQARVWATKNAGHRVKCPACDSSALVFGEPVNAPVQRLVDGKIIETHEHLPNRFECVACGLKIAGHSQLTEVGLGDRYRKTQSFDLAEYYMSGDEYSGWEDDNNEP